MPLSCLGRVFFVLIFIPIGLFMFISTYVELTWGWTLPPHVRDLRQTLFVLLMLYVIGKLYFRRR
jgi:hypothetical protein